MLYRMCDMQNEGCKLLASRQGLLLGNGKWGQRQNQTQDRSYAVLTPNKRGYFNPHAALHTPICDTRNSGYLMLLLASQPLHRGNNK